MAGPDKQFDKLEVLERAMKLFWAKGYEATSMQALVDAMGINRASMYQTFGNKHALFDACIDHYIDQITCYFTQVRDEAGSPLHKLQRLFQYLIEQSLQQNKHGCFINNTAVELATHDAEIAKKIRVSWRNFESIFATLLQDALQNKELAADTDCHQLAILLNITLQGLLVKTKTHTSKAQLFTSIESFFFLIRTLNN